MIKLIRDITGVEPEVTKIGIYVILAVAVILSLWSRDLSEFVAWSLVLYLAWRLWRQPEPKQLEPSKEA